QVPAGGGRAHVVVVVALRERDQRGLHAAVRGVEGPHLRAKDDPLGVRAAAHVEPDREVRGSVNLAVTRGVVTLAPLCRTAAAGGEQRGGEDDRHDDDPGGAHAHRLLTHSTVPGAGVEDGSDGNAPASKADEDAPDRAKSVDATVTDRGLAIPGWTEALEGRDTAGRLASPGGTEALEGRGRGPAERGEAGALSVPTAASRRCASRCP